MQQSKKWYSERNSKIFQRYEKGGITLDKLASEYEVTRGRISQIVNEEKDKRKKMDTMVFKQGECVSLRDRMVAVFSFIDNEESKEKMSTANVKSSIYCVFRYLKFNHNIANPKEVLNEFLKFRYEDLIRIRNVGIRKAYIIQRIQDEIESDWDKYEMLLTKNCVIVC